MARSSSSKALPDTSASGFSASGVSGQHTVPGTHRPSNRSFPAHLLSALRPRQWTKNLLVFAGLLFGLRLFSPAALGRSFAAFVIFCGLSGAVYLINDVRDRDSDRQHPHKAQRAIASGALSVPAATAIAIVLIAAGLIVGFWLNPPFGAA